MARPSSNPARGHRPGPRWWRRPAFVVVVASVVPAVVSGCASDHGVFSPHGSGASRISVIGWVMVLTSAAIAVVFLGLLLWAIVRGGVRPPWRSESGLVVAGGILLPVAVIVVLSVMTMNALNDR